MWHRYVRHYVHLAYPIKRKLSSRILGVWTWFGISPHRFSAKGHPTAIPFQQFQVRFPSLSYTLGRLVHQKDCYSSRDSRIPPPDLGHDKRTRSPGGATIGTLEFAQSTREILVAEPNLVLVIPSNHANLSVTKLGGGNSRGRASGFGASLKGDISTLTRQKT